MRTRLTVVEELGLFAKAQQGPIALEDDRGFERHRSGDHPRRVVPSDATIVRRAIKIGGLVLHPGIVFKRLVAMGKSRRNPSWYQLSAVSTAAAWRPNAGEPRRTSTARLKIAPRVTAPACPAPPEAPDNAARARSPSLGCACDCPAQKPHQWRPRQSPARSTPPKKKPRVSPMRCGITTLIR
jgi:hypothetical protein